MSNDKNKSDLNLSIAKMTNDDAWSWKKQYCITHSTHVWKKFGQSVVDEVMYKSVGQLEEADNRMVCHNKDMLINGISTIIVRTLDSDVVVVLMS